MNQNLRHHPLFSRSRHRVRGCALLFLFLAATLAFSGPLFANDLDEIPPMAMQDGWQLIQFEGQLWAIEDTPEGKYRLINDLDLGGYENWRPIGRRDNSLIPFRGQFDGGGFTIRNLNITGDTLDNAGFFATIDSTGVVENLVFENAHIEGGENVGILAGVCRGSVQNVSVAGSVYGVQYVGGLVGLLDGGTVEGASSKAEVGGGDRAGGLVGLSRSDEIHRSRSTGDVGIEGDSDRPGLAGIGGLVGQAIDYVRISECFATGNVSGNYGTSAGGLIGSISSQGYDSRVENCFATGSVRGSKVGGLIGWTNSPAVISHTFAAGSVTGPYYQTKGGLIGQLDTRTELINCYYDLQTTGVNRLTGDGIPKSTAEMEAIGTYEDWSIAVYTPNPADDFADFHYPLLRFVAGGSGTAPAGSGAVQGETTWVLNNRNPPLPLPRPRSEGSSGCSAGAPSALLSLLLFVPLMVLKR